MQNNIINRWSFNQTPQEVWEYLTQAELMAQWLMPNNFEPRLGHNFEFRSKPIPSLNLDGVFHCKVLEIELCKKLVYSWKGGPEKGIITLDTMVEWTLEATDKGTELHLIQSGFTSENISIFSAMQGGWDANVKKIIAQLDKKNNASSNV